MSANQVACLFVEADATDPSTAPVALPVGHDSNMVEPGGEWIELPTTCATSLSRDLQPTVVCLEDGEPAGPLVFESVQVGIQHHLLMMVKRGHQVTINMLRAAPVNILNVGDIVEFAGRQLHVSLLNRPYIGPPTEAQIGRPCGYCQVPIEDQPDMRVYECPSCQLPMHFQDETVSADVRLECARLASACRHCQTAIVMREGFTYVPKF
jgi:hypothetical protein